MNFLRRPKRSDGVQLSKRCKPVKSRSYPDPLIIVLGTGNGKERKQNNAPLRHARVERNGVRERTKDCRFIQHPVVAVLVYFFPLFRCMAFLLRLFVRSVVHRSVLSFSFLEKLRCILS